jgi:hypothetical protein
MGHPALLSKAFFGGKLDGEWGAGQLHAIGLKESLVLRGHCVGFGYVEKECLHPASGGKGDQDSSAAISREGPDVRYLPAGEDGVALVQGEPLVADLNEKLTFKHVEPLVLVQMQMARGTAFVMGRLLDGEEIPSCVVCDHLKRHGGDTEVMGFAEAILAGGDGASRQWRWSVR